MACIQSQNFQSRYSCSETKSIFVLLLKNPFFPIIRARIGKIAKTFHTHSVIWTRYPMRSFKTIASKKSVHVRNSYICLNVEKMTKSHFWKKPLFPIIQARMDDIAKHFHTYSVIWTRYPVQSFKNNTFKKSVHVRNSYICFNVEKMT